MPLPPIVAAPGPVDCHVALIGRAQRPRVHAVVRIGSIGLPPVNEQPICRRRRVRELHLLGRRAAAAQCDERERAVGVDSVKIEIDIVGSVGLLDRTSTRAARWCRPAR